MSYLTAGPRWFTNRGDYYVLAAMPVAAFFGAVLAHVLFSPPLLVLVPGALTGLVVLLALAGHSLVFKVGISPDEVVIMRLVSKFVLTRTEVSRVVLDPPVTRVDAEPRLWGKGSALLVYRGDTAKKPLILHNLEDGLKLRVARALAPSNYPGDPLEVS